jgi:peptidoglycan L-alanyl-D-glutamate endopeptidase CwlK
MASRQLDDLDPKVKGLAVQHLVMAAEHGLQVLVYCTYRSPEEQAQLFWRGRTSDQVELRARRLEGAGCHGLADLLRSVGPQAGPKVTYAGPGESYHQYRLAYDCVPIVNGKAVWSTSGDGERMWQTLGQAGQQCGLEWAGTWSRFCEYPHFQDPQAPPVHTLMQQQFADVLAADVSVAAAAVNSESDLLRECLAVRESVVMVMASNAGATDAAVETTFELARRVAATMAPEIWRAFWVRDPAGLDHDLQAALYPDAQVRQAVVLAQATGLPRQVAQVYDVTDLQTGLQVYTAFAQG